MTNVGHEIGNSKHSLFYGTNIETIYLSDFDDELDVDDDLLPFGEEINHQK